MKQHILKSLISTVLILCLIITSAGCSKANDTKTNSTDNTTQASEANSYSKGRYLEHIYDPDPDLGGETIFHVVPENSSEKVEGKLTVNLSNFTYCLENDGSWTKKELDWLSEVDDADDISYDLKSLTIGEDGKEYALLNKWTKDCTSTPYLAMYQKINNKVTPVDISGLNDLLNCNRVDGQWGEHDFSNFFVTKDGDFVLIYADYAQLVKKDGKVSDLCSNINGFTSIVCDGKLYALASDLKAINIYDIESAQLDHTVSTDGLFPVDSYYRFAVLGKDQNNTIYLQCINGIYQLVNDTLTQIIDGTLTSMGGTNSVPYELSVDSDGNFINIRGDLDYSEWHIYHYIYDPDVASYPEEEVTIYSLIDNKEIRDAIVQFQNANPNVALKYTIAIDPTQDTDFTLKDYIQALNTDLLANKGPDILFLDYMDTNNLMDKGILTDITEAIENNPDIYDTVKHTFTKDNKIYAIPSRIQIPVITGETDAMKAADSLQGLADYSKTSDKKLFGSLELNYFVLRLYEAYKNEIYDESQTVNIDKVRTFLENMKTIYDNSDIWNDDPEEDYRYETNSIYRLLDHTSSLGTGLLSYSENVAEVMALSKKAKTTMSSMNHSYIPVNIFSINKNSDKKEIALQFLQQLLSKESQDKEYYNGGIAVNKQAVPCKLLTYNPMERGWITRLPYYDTQGVSKEVKTYYPTEEEAKAYVPLYDEIQRPIIRDTELDDTMTQLITNYLKGDVTLDDSITKMNSFLYIYNGE